MNATDVLKLLAARHKDDVFVPECKTGATYTGTGIRMDAWAMAKSWTRPRTWAYEIKVHRSDFIRDNKWHQYLPYCSEFYFVCPTGLIAPEELPQDVGLLWISKVGGRLLTKRKAAARQVQIPEDLWRYLLMWRTKIKDEHTERPSVERWRAWLEEKRERRRLGYEIKGRIRELWDEQKERNDNLESRVQKLENIKARMLELGFDPNAYFSEWHVERRLNDLAGADTKWAEEELNQIVNRLEDCRRRLSKIGAER